MTFRREWHPATYEIGSSTQKPPIILLCGDCPAVNQAQNRPPVQSSDAASFGAGEMPASGKVTLLEWNP